MYLIGCLWRRYLSLFAVSCSVIGLLYLHLSHIQLHDILYTISYVPSFVSSFSLQRSKNVCRRRLSLIGLIHTYRRWVPCRFNVPQCSSIYLSMYVSIGFQSIRHWNLHIKAWDIIFFTVLLIEGSAGRDHEVDIVYILNVDEVHEIVN